MSSLSKSQLDETAVENFREYLRIPSVQPNVNYDECVTFINKQAKSLDLPVKVYRVHPTKPIVIVTWEGTDPSAPAIWLNSHMDVVPVIGQKWTHPPFAADMDEHGNIYARGSQDMKCVGIQYLEAIRRMKLAGQHFKRTIRVAFVPDEEIGGKCGMKDFVNTKDFQQLNIGFALDEGVASPTERYPVYYGERTTWQIEIKCTGFTGHGSLLVDNTAGEKLRYIIDKFMDLRAVQRKKLSEPNAELGDVTTINLTEIKGGIQENVIPPEVSVVFDIRLDPTVDPDQFEATIQKWCEEAGSGVTYSFVQKNPKPENSKIDDTNPFWVAFKRACDNNGIAVHPAIFPAGTDSRFIRQVNIPAFGFSPISNTPILAHAVDEYLNKDVFLKGIEIYMKIIPEVANI